ASNAFAIASRLGLDRDVLDRAESHLSELHRSLERTLREAERQRTELASTLDEARIAAEDARRATSGAEREAARVREDAEGALRLRVPASSLREAPAPELATRPTRATVHGSATDVPLQLDLRGARAEEALAVLDRYLNDAAVAGIDRLRIVHGKGTGALRTAVREMLSSHPLVREQVPASPSEGGDGATIVRL